MILSLKKESSRHQQGQIAPIWQFRNERHARAPLLPHNRSNSDTSWDHDLPTTLSPQLVVQVQDDRVQTCVNPSRLKPKARC